jgi:hypothetical protein
MANTMKLRHMSPIPEVPIGQINSSFRRQLSIDEAESGKWDIFPKSAGLKKIKTKTQKVKAGLRRRMGG